MSLRSVLLTLLSNEPNSGYGIRRLLQRELNHVWDARLQQIYGELAKLQREGLVSVERIELSNRPPKKVYSLTAQGQQALDAWLAQRPASASCKDDLLVRLCALPRMPPDLVLRRLEERRDECEQRASALRQSIAQARRTDPVELGRLLTLELAVSQEETQVAWCQRALSVLGDAAQPAPAARGSELRAAEAS